MRKSILLISITIFCSYNLHANGIQYESTFEKAVDKVLQQQKPLAVFIYDKPKTTSTQLISGLEDECVIWKYNNNFINLQVDRNDLVLYNRLVGKYKIKKFPTVIFFDTKCKLLFNDTVNFYNESCYLELASKALFMQKKDLLAVYDSTYNAGNRKPDFLRIYITKKQSLGLMDNAGLIEEYVDGLKKSDLDDYSKVLFILKAGPVIDGKAYKRIWPFNKTVERIYKTESYKETADINQSINGNTLDYAIKSRCISLARAAANFTRISWGRNYKRGLLEEQRVMLHYYENIKDSARYMSEAISYNNRYFMNMSIDSIRKMDSVRFEDGLKFLNECNPDNVDDMTLFNIIGIKNNTISFYLNHLAWYFYNYSGTSKDYLEIAIVWINRSIELNPRSYNYDTYAHLLYRLKNYDEAENMQRKALELRKKERKEMKTFELAYEKIKNRTL